MNHLTALTEAWLSRARRAEADLNAAHQAPALFSPAFVIDREREYAKAMERARFWHSQAVSA